MENKTDRKNRAKRLEELAADGMSLAELIRCLRSADPEPVRKQEKKERKARKERKAKNKPIRSQP
jgi:hypothetical protein